MAKAKVVVLISGQAATGKSTLGRALARKLGVRYYSGGEALMSIARRMGYDARGRKWWDTPEGMKFLAEREANFEFDRMVDQELMRIAEERSSVIDSWVLPWLMDSGYKIWLKASLEVRARRLATRGKMPLEEALKVLKEREERNKSLYREIYGIRWGEDMEPFHLVLDTTDLQKEDVLGVALSAVRSYVRSRSRSSSRVPF
ncbi:MAG: cytidylate kinase family protein [Thaumarchaeota archaeon]|nr:cytidylate kinase family protein [Candidatus Calditenuaceae archaeon]MDW8041941.1 cytidylate kinase family protein [Nitrososphaerota archaeon]